MSTDPHYWRKERARVERNWRAIYGEVPHGKDWAELCAIAELEERANRTTAHKHIRTDNDQ